MKKIFTILAALTLTASVASAKDYSVNSPSGDLKMVISVSDQITYSLMVKGQPVLSGCKIEMQLADGRILGAQPKVKKESRGFRRETINAPFYRQSSFNTAYNYVSIRFTDDFTLQVRAYNDGVAYRFVTSFPEEITVRNEIAQFNFAGGYDVLAPYAKHYSKDIYETSFENTYTEHKIGSGYPEGLFGFLPILVTLPSNAGRLILMESDVENYPGIFMQPTEKGYDAVFAPMPLKFKPSDRGVDRPTEYSENIATAAGSRSFPWRIIGYAAKDTDLPVNNMVYQTASASRISDISWIRPGQSTWDWWNDFVRYGVDFKSGINTATYKYDIDFASKHHIPYVILDEGWYRNLNPLDINPDVDIEYLCGYAQESGVGLILWMTSTLLWKNMDAICDRYSKLGVAGFKVDFFDAHDQNTVKVVYDLAETCSRYKLVLDLHGIYKPTGLSRTYPNVLNYEGVFGQEQMKWNDNTVDMPRNDVLISYIRQVSGPMDYTQGALRNAQRNNFRGIHSRPMSQGTRAHQVGEYIVFDSPLVMLCDSPSDYAREPETTDFINAIPATFNSTAILQGEVGEFIVTMREKDGKRYVGGITNWTARDIKLPLNFLEKGAWTAKIFRDGINAEALGDDFISEVKDVTLSDTLELHLAPGGGFAIIFETK